MARDMLRCNMCVYIVWYIVGTKVIQIEQV